MRVAHTAALRWWSLGPGILLDGILCWRLANSRNDYALARVGTPGRLIGVGQCRSVGFDSLIDKYLKGKWRNEMCGNESIEGVTFIFPEDLEWYAVLASASLGGDSSAITKRNLMMYSVRFKISEAEVCRR